MAESVHFGRPFFNGATMRPITVLIFALVIFLINVASGTSALSHGAVGLCTQGRFTIVVSASKDEPTPEAARSAARAAFVPDTFWKCEAPDRFVSFSDSCVAVVTHGGPSDTNATPIEERHFWVRSGLSGQEAMTDAFEACRASAGTGCTLKKLVCDGAAARPAVPSRPALSDSVSQSPPLPDVQSSVKDIPTDPLFSLATLNRYIELASNDIRQFISQYDRQWSTLIAATAGVCLFVGAQLYSIIRTGRRRLRDIAFNASASFWFVLIVTTGWLVSSYAIQKLIAFGTTLSPAGRLLLISVVIGIILLAIPYPFWRALAKIFSGPRAPVPTGEQPVTPPQTSSFAETRSDNPILDDRAGNVVSMVQPQAPEVNVSGDASPRQPIVLLLKRSQKPAMSGMIYMLDARIDVSAEVRSLIATHKLGNRVIYESEARQRHAENVRGHLDSSRSGTPIFAPAGDQAKGLGRTLWGLARAGVSAARAALALKITVSSLMAGVHVECKDMEELLEAEGAIREAKENLEGFLETAKTFDGREEIG